MSARAWLAVASLGLVACSPTERRFPLRAPVWQDLDARSVTIPCRPAPTREDAAHVSCAPEVYRSPELWDEADSLVFRPLSETMGLTTSGEAADVNSVDEVPDSSWFTNRLGVGATGRRELALGGCDPSQLLHPDSDADGTWVIDRAKTNGDSAGFRVIVPGKGKYMLKADSVAQPEQSTAASVIGAAAYHAVGYETTCEQIVYFRPSLLSLTPGLRMRKGMLGDDHPFDRKAVDDVLAGCPKRGGLVRMVASAWLPGQLLGPFRYEGTRHDDPNDVVAHQDRRELRAARLLAAWLGHVDSHEQNSMDLWVADRRQPPDSSPGHVVHAFLDWGDCLGSDWPQEPVTERMGYSYILDLGDMATDFAQLGAGRRPWESGRAPGHELFGYYDVERFVPEQWKSEYPNPAFTRMTERDGAWMARILARFTPELVGALGELAAFSDPSNTAYVTRVLQGRLDRILERYLTRVSPVADLQVEGADRLCGVDLVEQRRLRNAARMIYTARRVGGQALRVERHEAGRICVVLPHVAADAGAPDDAPERYVRVAIEDGVARGALLAHLYDLGPVRGYRLAGLERPDP